MAKRKAPQPIKSIPKPGLVATDTGIYTTTAIDASSPASLDVEREIVAAARAMAAAPRSTSLEEVVSLRDQLRETLRSAIYEDGAPLHGWATRQADLGDGPQGYLFNASPEAGIEETLKSLESVTDFLATSPNEAAALAFRFGMSVGVFLERKQVRSKEHYALQGKAHSRSQSDRRRGGTLTPAETAIVQAELKQRQSSGAAKANAARIVSALLLKGEVEGINRSIEYSAERIRKLPG